MKAVSGFTIDTASYRFELTIFRNPERRPRFVARFVGASIAGENSEAASQQRTDVAPAGTLEGFYLDRLILQCRAAIDRIDGPILRMLPRKVTNRERSSVGDSTGDHNM